MDERHLGLLPVACLHSAPRPVSLRIWLGAPQTGQTWWALLATVNIQAISGVLATCAAGAGIDGQHRVVLVLDCAGWHTAKSLGVSASFDLLFMLPSSPELQPAKRLWPLLFEPLANRNFTDLDALENVLVRRCQILAVNRRRVKAHPRYHWWTTGCRPRRNAR